MTFKPLLSATCETKDIEKLRWPLLASPKLDGIRVIIKDGVALSRSLKPIPNRHVQNFLGFTQLDGLDGEIIAGSATEDGVWRNTQSGIMSAEGEPNFTFHVFDNYLLGEEFQKRLEIVRLTYVNHDIIKPVGHVFVSNAEELKLYEEACLTAGYEGVMLRDPHGVYKQGRSTLREGILMKVKQFKESEAVVIGFEERMHNANEAKVNALGHTERSSHKENMIGRGDLGALKVRNAAGVEFTVGSGFDDATRDEIWRNQDKYLGRTITYKHMVYGEYEAPRFPVFKGFRDERDMS